MRKSPTRAVLTLALLTLLSFATPAAAEVFPGGFLEKTTSGEVRPLYTAAQIQTFMPSIGAFTFPPPYNTEAVRITNASDCGGGDCVQHVGYSYWANINNHTGSDTMLIVLGLNQGSGGTGPTLFSYDKVTEEVNNLGPLFDPNTAFGNSTVEGWYFSASMPHAMYMMNGSKLSRFDVITKQLTTVFDAATWVGAGHYLWQTHSSADDSVHVGTIRSSSTYAMLGCAAYKSNTNQFSYFPAVGTLDECHLDKSGRWLVMLDNVDYTQGEDNRIIDLQTGIETLLLDQDGAAGHADMGYGYMLAEDNWASVSGAMRMWKLGQTPLVGELVYSTSDWLADAGHVAHGNSLPGVAPEQQFACNSNATRAQVARSNEIVCYRLDDSQDVAIVAPVMTNLDSPGGGDDYSKRPKGNIDVTGEYFIWTSNMAGNRLDAFVVKVPTHLLTGETWQDSSPPVVSISSPTAGVSVTGNVTVSSNASDDVGVTGVQFRLNGSNLGAEDTNAPYAVTWNTTGVTAGQHTLTAVARDAVGNTTTSAGVTVTIAGGTPVTTSPNGLVAHWEFSTSGRMALDSTANHFNGVRMSGVSWAPGWLGQGMQFDGVDDWVRVPHHTALNAYPLTVVAAVKTSATGLHGIVNKYQASSMNGYQIFTSDGNLCAWYFRNENDRIFDGTSCTLKAPGFNDGQWHQVVFVVDAAGGTLYVDGAPQATQPWIGTPGPTTSARLMSLGRYPGTAAPFLPGSLDEVRIYERALPPAEVQALYVEALAAGAVD